MLPISERSPHRDGYYLEGTYTLAIARMRDGVIDATDLAVSYDFAKPPTDIDTSLMFPNDVHPDQGNGVFVSVNEVGTGLISIRGNTGQFPKRNMLQEVLGTVGGSLTSGIGSVARSVPQALGTVAAQDGYQLWVALYNFFAQWSYYVRSSPHEVAMLFFNHKDLEFLHVVPNSFRKVRNASAPMRYGYDIQLQVLGEVDYSPQISWQEREASIRSDIDRWKRFVDRALLLTSMFTRDIATGFISAGINPVRESALNMSAGIQGLKYTSDIVASVASSAWQAMKQPQEMLFAQELNRAYQNNGKTLTQYNIPEHAVSQITPPTRRNLRDVLDPTRDMTDEVIVGLSKAGGTTTTEATTELSLDDDLFTVWENVLDLYITGMLIEDGAPLAEETPAYSASAEMSEMHRAARAASAGMVYDREDEFASALLSGDTEMIGDTRHPRATEDRDRSQHSLSYLAAKLLPGFVQSEGTGVPAQLDSYRRAFLGSRDPSKISSLYRAVRIKPIDSIYSLAVEHLGSWTRWAEIAFVNGLAYPYITERTGPYTVGRGDVIYIPSRDANIDPETVENLLNIAKTHDLVSLQDLFLGFDWEISAITGDFVWGEYDFTHVAGVKAFMQEVAIVLEGQGGVTPDQHRLIPMKVGTKSRGNVSLGIWRALIANWFESDHRVERVEWVTLKQDRDVVSFSAKLKFEHYDESITVAGALRN